MDIDSHVFDRLRARVSAVERALATNDIIVRPDLEHGSATHDEIWGDAEKAPPAPDLGEVMQRLEALERTVLSLGSELAVVSKRNTAPSIDHTTRLQRHTTRLSGLEARMNTLETSHQATTGLIREQQATRDRNNTPSRLIDRILATGAPFQVVAAVETAINRNDLARARELVESHEARQ